MSTVLVTGGTGDLGRELVPRLVRRGHDVRVLSRREAPPVPEGVKAVRGDLVTGDGLVDALDGADVIVHAATGSRDHPMRGLTYRTSRRTDVESTKRMLEATPARPHVVYISIVGIDRVPLGYYRAKLESEQVIESSGLPYTILRTTQWHTLVDEVFRRAVRGPVGILPRGFAFQVLDPGEVADRMAELASGDPAGHVADMGGPAVRPIEDLARAWVDHHGRRTRVVTVPVPGRTARAFRAGHNTCPDHADGKIGWEDWLGRNHAR